MCENRHTFSRTETKYFVGATEIPANQLRQIPGYMFAELFPNRRDGFTIKYGTKPVQIPDRDRIPVAEQKADHLATLGHWKHRRVERGEMTEAQYAAEMANAEKNWSPSSAFAYLVTNATPPQAIDRVIKWERKEKQTMCGAKCRNARGPNCDCVCEGKFHGVSVGMSRARFASSDIDLKPTAEMAANAERGLRLREEHGRGGTAVGVARARDIKNRSNLSPDTVKRMHSFFSRHEGNQAGGEDDAGYIAWLLWGGDAGKAWAARKVEQINKTQAARTGRGSDMASKNGAKEAFAQIDPSVSGVRIDPYTTKVPLILKDGRSVTAIRTNGQWGIAEMPEIAPRWSRDIYGFVERLNRDGFSRPGAKAKFDRRMELDHWTSPKGTRYTAGIWVSGDGLGFQPFVSAIYADGGEQLMSMNTPTLKSEKGARKWLAKYLAQNYSRTGTFSRPGAKAKFGNGENNRRLLQVLGNADYQLANKVVQNIKSHYGISDGEVYNELFSDDAEHLLDYVTEPVRSAAAVILKRKGMMSRPGAKARFDYTDAKVEGDYVVWGNGQRMKIVYQSTIEQKPQATQEVIRRNPRHWIGDYKLEGPKGAVYSLDYYTTGNYQLTGSGGRVMMRGKLLSSRPGAKASMGRTEEEFAEDVQNAANILVTWATALNRALGIRDYETAKGLLNNMSKTIKSLAGELSRPVNRMSRPGGKAKFAHWTETTRVVESLSYENIHTGQKVSGGGAVPWTTEAGKNDWKPVRYFVFMDTARGTTFGGRYNTQAGAQAALDKAKRDHAAEVAKYVTAPAIRKRIGEIEGELAGLDNQPSLAGRVPRMERLHEELNRLRKQLTSLGFSRPGAKAEMATLDGSYAKIEVRYVFPDGTEDRETMSGPARNAATSAIRRIKARGVGSKAWVIGFYPAHPRGAYPAGTVEIWKGEVANDGSVYERGGSFSRPGEAEAFAIGATSDIADPAKDEALTALAAKVGREHTVNLFKRWSEGKASMTRSEGN
jgi:hypothetical protein